MHLDKIAVITGAANGIGRELARKWSHQGYTIWAIDLSQEGLSSLEEEILKQGGTVHSFVTDVTSENELRKIANRLIAEKRSVALWINNAGVAGTGALDSLSYREISKVLEINLNALVLGTKLALEIMTEQGAGTIVNVASVAGHVPAPLMSAYVASKHGVVGFTRSIHAELELKCSPVKMVLVSPGFVETQMVTGSSAIKFPEWLSWLLATPESVAEEVWQGISAGKSEICPTLNGRWMLRFQRHFPHLAIKSSRVLLTKSWKDLFLNRFDAC